ncbi:MAG TPA: hypothetical protein VGD92_13435, partial [Sphingobacteriaceae bacterium]
GESGLVFEVVYIVETADYNRYMDIQQDINFRIFEQFRELGIELAYPTTALYVKRGGHENPGPQIISE